jgi:serine/threonine protein kinase/sugar lactone lactonase YvrE
MNRWQQIEKICQSALELDESQRTTFLKEACGGDEELHREVESLMKFGSRGEGFIEQRAFDVVAKMIAQQKPESLIGQRIGSYQVLSLLGAGGMGVVYKARDSRLNRVVAIKVLPSDKVSDPQRKHRFSQEARAASALNHPNIITLHDVGNESGIDYIVMEFVAGKSLDRLIPRKGMRLGEALKLAVQMADALARAHSTGIIHRDLKPTNVMVTDDGLAKVLDFGLAKLTEQESGEGETRTLQSQTEEGMIIGTLSYMSPEQAEGRKVDARSDIFSFGSVLYEMVSGQRAFQGDSNLSTLAAIVNQEPKPIRQLVPGIPPDLEKVIHRCLRKDPERRFQYMADIKVALQDLKEESESGTAAQPQVLNQLPRRAWVWAVAVLAIVAIAVASWLIRATGGRPQAAPKVAPLTSYAGIERSPSFSPDGNQVAFSWNGEKQDNFDIYIKPIGSPTAERLTMDPAEDGSPAFSPDGRSIGFVRVAKERATFIILPAIGGPERPVAEVPATYLRNGIMPSFAWFPDAKWVITDGLVLLSTENGQTRRLTTPPTKSSSDSSPAISPDGRTVAFVRDVGLVAPHIYLLDLTEGLKPKGEPRRLTSLNARSPAWAPSGREIIFASGPFVGNSLWRVPASGAGEPAQLPFSVGGASSPAISRTGNRLAYHRDAVDSNIWRLSLSSPGMSSASSESFISSTRRDMAAQYSPDGKRIAFESDRSGLHGIWVCNADRSHCMDLFLQPGANCGTARWSPDGQRVAFDCIQEGNLDIYVIRASGGKPIPLTTGSAHDDAPSWSRDGKWVYFTSNRSGRFEVWKVPAGGGEAVPVTRNGGGTAFESPDGESIYYIKGNNFSGPVWKMPVSGGEESQVLPFVVDRAFSLVKEGIYFIPGPSGDRKSSIQFLSFATGKVKTVARMSGRPSEGLSVSPDGRSLLFSQDDQSGSDLILVENFQ